VGEGVDGELKGGEGADVEVEPVEGPPEEGVLLQQGGDVLASRMVQTRCYAVPGQADDWQINISSRLR
jgi:hypothetical protein